MNNTYEEFKKLVLDMRISVNPSERKMIKDMMNMAYEYTGIRMNWNFLSIEEKVENDRYRTLAHNRVIKAFKDLITYALDKDKISEEFFSAFYRIERKELGDFANQLVCDMAIEMR